MQIWESSNKNLRSEVEDGHDKKMFSTQSKYGYIPYSQKKNLGHPTYDREKILKKSRLGREGG